MRVMQSHIHADGDRGPMVPVPTVSNERFFELVQFMVPWRLSPRDRRLVEKCASHGWCARPTADYVREQYGVGEVSNDEMDLINRHWRGITY